MYDPMKIKEQDERIKYLEDQVAMLTDLLAESQFRERIQAVEEWVVAFDAECEAYGDAIVEGLEVTLVPDQEMLDAVTRDKSKDN